MLVILSLVAHACYSLLTCCTQCASGRDHVVVVVVRGEAERFGKLRRQRRQALIQWVDMCVVFFVMSGCEYERCRQKKQRKRERERENERTDDTRYFIPEDICKAVRSLVFK